MAIKLKNTADIKSAGVKMLVYGQSGAGKTPLIGSLPNPVILSAESGLLSLSRVTAAYVEIRSVADIKDSYSWITNSAEAGQFASVAIDSLSEIAEVCLAEEKKKTRDPRQAYGAMQEAMAEIIRAFRDLPHRHVYFSAKLEKSKDEMDKVSYGPSMPGKQLGPALPYFFDEVLALRIERDESGEMHKGLMCESDGKWIARDRSGFLSAWEAPDLGAIIKKITGENQ